MSGRTRPAGVGPSLTIFFTSVLDCCADGKCRGNSALWDEHGRLIVRADRGSLLLVGQRSSQGWQGDIIPLR